MATRLVDLARVIRSKNAGPLQVTLDLMFADRAGYERAVQSPALSAEAVARLYGVDPATTGLSSTILIACAGSPGDTDVYGAQQHRPLLEVVL
jgi:hypothetical protein